jgi:predicted nucleic acid-binding protein
VTNFPIAHAAVFNARKKIKNAINSDTTIQINLNSIHSESAEKYMEKGRDEKKQLYYYLVYI